MDILSRSRYIFEDGSWKMTQYYAYCFQDQRFKLLAQGSGNVIKVWTWSNLHTPSTPCYHSSWEQVIRTANHYMNNIDHMLRGFSDEES